MKGKRRKAQRHYVVDRGGYTTDKSVAVSKLP